MLLRVTALVLFFPAWVRFLSNESIPSVTRRRYGHDTLKLLRNFEKLDYKIRNIELDICFLRKCESKDVVPNFLKFRLANKNLKNSMTYRKCQRQLLKAEIDSKESRLKVLRNKFNHVKCELQIILNFIDFAHICSLFFISNDRSLEKHDKTQQNKFSELLKEYSSRNDPEKVIFNFSKATLNESEKALLSKGLNFFFPPKQLKYADYLLNFELFFRDICKLGILSNENLEFLKIKIEDVALSSLRYFNLNVPQHLSDSEFQALKNLSRLKKEVIIQKSDKGNSVVLVNKSDYIRHIEGILKDVNKFEKVSLKKGILNFAVNHEEHINKQLRSISKNGNLT